MVVSVALWSCGCAHVPHASATQAAAAQVAAPREPRVRDRLMRRAVIRMLLALAAVLGMSAACGARDDGDFEFDPGSGGDGGTSAVSGRGGASRGGEGTLGRGGTLGRAGAFGRGGTGGGFGTAGAFGSAGMFGRPGTSGTAGMFGTGGRSPDGSVGRGGSAGRGLRPDGGPEFGPENCLNAWDDDDDGAIDCEDSDCTPGYTCAPPFSHPWWGPGQLWLGSEPPGDAFCQEHGNIDSFASGHLGAIAGTPQCADCLCDPPADIVCPNARLSFSPSSDCSSPGSPLTIPSNMCQAFLLSSVDARSFRWEASPATDGACQPRTDGSSVIPPLRWSQYAEVCVPPLPGGGCGTGFCVPRPESPFAAGICIVIEGDLACPGNYRQRFVYYQGLLDTRDCTECSCTSPSGAVCSGSVTVGSDALCSADRSTVQTIGSCGTLGADPSAPAPPLVQSRSAFYSEGAATGGSCAASGGAATGTVSETDPITICCTDAPDGGGGRFRLPGLRPKPGPAVDSGAD
jgi:hypothetical protein